MRMKMMKITILALAVAFTAPRPAVAHHAFGSEFDANAPVLLKGKIVKFEWVNPHTWIHVEIVKDDGNKEVWMVEGGSPNTLLRRGANKNTFPVGMEIVVDGYQARDHSLLRANGRNITYPDGRKLLLGSSAPAAENDQDPIHPKK